MREVLLRLLHHPLRFGEIATRNNINKQPSRSISGAVAGEASSSSTRFQSTNLISPHLHYLPFASGFPLPHFTIFLSFSSLPLHQFAVLFASLFRSPFSC